MPPRMSPSDRPPAVAPVTTFCPTLPWMGDTVSARTLAPVVGFAKGKYATTLPIVLPAEPDDRVSVGVLLDLLVAAETATEDRLFGFRLASAGDPRRLHALAYAAANAATVRDSIESAARYLRIWNESVVLELTTTAGKGRAGQGRAQASVTLRPTASSGVASHRGFAQLALLSLTTTFTMLRGLRAAPFVPDEVRFAISGATLAPDASGELTVFFGAPVLFDGSVSEIRFDAALLDEPVEGADPELRTLVARAAEDLLAKVPTTTGWSARVREHLLVNLARGAPSLEETGRALGLAGRTLQRRLDEEKISFQQLLDAVRLELADRYLRDPERPVTEVAFLLGYRDASAFYRAFDRWLGMTPVEHRRSLIARGVA
jgi:AraC-like DNA-binding protein